MNINAMKQCKKQLKGLARLGLVVGACSFPSIVDSAANSSQFTAAPPFVATSVGKPNVVIALDISGSMKAVAYRDGTANWSRSTTIHADFNPSASYFGYFDSTANYSYDASSNKNFFYEDATGGWNGNFLNWLTMRRMDVVRKVLVGGKVRDRNGEIIDGDTWYVIEGQHEPSDRTFRKSYSLSSTVSPFANDSEILISEGMVSLNNESNTQVVALSDDVEIGQVSINRNTSADGDLNSTSNWLTVNYTHTYSNPIVVTTGLSYNGSDPTHARIRNVTASSFQVRLEEWDYRDVNHTTEEVSYIVAEDTGTGSLNISVDNIDYEVRAGSVRTQVTSTSTINTQSIPLSSSGYTPVVFAGASSNEDERPVITRIRNVSATRFELTLQNEEDLHSSAPHPSAEDVHWIAFEPVTGNLDQPGRPAIDIGDNGGNTVTDNFETVTFDGGANFFRGTPILAVGTQTINGTDPAFPRHQNITTSNFEVFMEEEKSDDSETSHTGSERVGYIAVDSASGYNIQLGVLEEPLGIIQENSGSMRFGLAVYNYDHAKDPTSIYNGNVVNGGTFKACYPNISLDVADRTNFDICLDTHVKSPLDNVIDVIEDHPLIWGTTPIAETLYDIKGYFAQTNFNRNGHTQYYDNGTELTSSPRNSYEVSNEWDPFYYDEFAAKLPCAKSFVLHFNDGAPFKDFDTAQGPHPTITNDGFDTFFGAQEVLDDLALELRQNDCRTDSGMDGHQEIISYYVYAALGETEALNNDTRRMREAAANGGFVDADGDLTPDAIPANFWTYVDSGFPVVTPTPAPTPIACPVTEWDSDADCNPDNFYFANDGAALVNELNAAFEAIVTRAATGGASSVIAASRSGEGSVVNAIFRPFVSSGTDEVTWIGDVHGLMIDDAGRIRQDDGDRTLEDASSDPYLDMCSDEVENAVRARTSSELATRPTADQFAACSASIFPLDLFDIEYLWSGADWLADLSNVEATSQRTYASTSAGRYIITGIDVDNNGIVQNAEQIDFLASSFPEAYAGLLHIDTDDAHDVIRYIRGEDVEGYRPRQLDGRTMRLGDVVYSTPTIVGRPAENLDLLYESQSYRAFFERYKNRRQMIYAGGNDGMIHAFNGGHYDTDTRQFSGAEGSSPGSTTNYDLGAELWAYAPYNTLPHLEYLMRPSYGSISSDHLYFVDLKPRIFDAKIFSSDTDHPGGWGTLLVMGMRLGGGATTTDINLSSSVTDPRTLRSSYIIFDITNPDNPPELLLEFSHQDLGFTTSIPTPVVMGSDSEGNGDWYLMIGSGADTTASGFDTVASTQAGKLFLIDLKEMENGSSTVLETAFGSSGIETLADSNSFISDFTAVDFGLDNFTTDAVYFGTVSGNSTDWEGKVYRVNIQTETNTAQRSVGSWSPTLVHDAESPVTAPVSISLDSYQNRWLFVGTGRYFTALDNIDNSEHYYYGLKEPRSTDGTFSYSTISSGLIDITSSRVQVNTGIIDSAPSLSPTLPAEATVHTLERRMREFNDATEYVPGWRRTLATGERNFGAATLLAGTLTFTSFDPLFDECSIEGDAYLYVVNAMTGTASSTAIIAQDDNATHNEYVINIGGSPATSPSLHRGEGYTTDNRTTAIVQTANGNIITVDQDNEEKVRDGEASWRQLQ